MSIGSWLGRYSGHDSLYLILFIILFMFCYKCGKEISPKLKNCDVCGAQPEGVNNSIMSEKRLITSEKGRRAGILWLVLPFGTLFAVVTLYAIARFVLGDVDVSGGSTKATIAGIINIALSFIGMIATIGIMISIPMAIISFNKKEQIDGKFDPRSGKGNLSDTPDEIKGWNWGAAAFTWIWGTTYGVWLSFLAFVPYFSYVWMIVLGIKGNQWAWESRQWESVDEFKKSQNKWKPWGMAVLLGPIILFVIVFLIGTGGALFE